MDQVVRTIFSIWDRTLFRLSASRATTVKLPTRSSNGNKRLRFIIRRFQTKMYDSVSLVKIEFHVIGEMQTVGKSEWKAPENSGQNI